MKGVNPIIISKEKALVEYKACKEAIKYKKGNQTEMIQLKKLYYHAMKGNKIIDIFEAFKFAGINDKCEPRLAIARADSKEVYFHAENPGTGYFSKDRWSNYRIKNEDVKLPDKTFCETWKTTGVIKTAVPMIPVSKRNKDLKNYYILWDVEKWDQVPKDPLLLKKITKNLFILIDKWNLTKLEQAIIRGR